MLKNYWKMSRPRGIGEQTMGAVQISGMMSIFDGAAVEKEIKRSDGVVRVEANFVSGTATIAYDETRVALDDINRLILCGINCGGSFCQHLLKSSWSAVTRG